MSKGDSSTLENLLNKKRKTEDELRNIERQIYELEGKYLEDTASYGNILKGWSSFLSGGLILKKDKKPVDPSDRLFSLSSMTAPKSEKDLAADLKVESRKAAPTNAKRQSIGGTSASSGLHASTTASAAEDKKKQAAARRKSTSAPKRKRDSLTLDSPTDDAPAFGS